MKRNKIRMTESQLRNTIKNTVYRILNEEMDERNFPQKVKELNRDAIKLVTDLKVLLSDINYSCPNVSDTQISLINHAYQSALRAAQDLNAIKLTDNSPKVFRPEEEKIDSPWSLNEAAKYSDTMNAYSRDTLKGKANRFLKPYKAKKADRLKHRGDRMGQKACDDEEDNRRFNYPSAAEPYQSPTDEDRKRTKKNNARIKKYC